MKKKIINIFFMQIILIFGIINVCFATSGINQTNPSTTPSKPSTSTDVNKTDGTSSSDSDSGSSKGSDIKDAIDGAGSLVPSTPEAIEEEVKKGTTGFNPDAWQPGSTTEVTNASKLQKIGNVIIGTIRTIGSILSVAVLIVIGIKYMIGSVEEKAEYKKTMMPYVIGAVLVFGITNILGIVASIATGLVE